MYAEFLYGSGVGKPTLQRQRRELASLRLVIPYRNQLRGWSPKLLGGLLDPGNLLGGRDRAEPDAFVAA